MVVANSFCSSAPKTQTCTSQLITCGVPQVNYWNSGSAASQVSSPGPYATAAAAQSACQTVATVHAASLCLWRVGGDKSVVVLTPGSYTYNSAYGGAVAASQCTPT